MPNLEPPSKENLQNEKTPLDVLKKFLLDNNLDSSIKVYDKSEKVNSYRINFFKTVVCDYWNKKGGKSKEEGIYNFEQLHEVCYPTIKKVRELALACGIFHIWHFYETYTEVTWLSGKETADKFVEKVKELLIELKCKEPEVIYPKDENDNFGDWFCENEKEKEFGCLLHAKCAEIVALFDEYKIDIKKGMGVKKQVARTIHRICNPLGLNYLDEAGICFSRWKFCVYYRLIENRVFKWTAPKIIRLFKIKGFPCG